MSSPIDEVNQVLRRAGVGCRPELVLLTGSSGCGKTFLCEELARQLDPERAAVAHFDKIGVPSEAEMIQGWGSGGKWQEAMTHEWINRVSHMTDKALVVFEGQYHPRFAVDACRALDIDGYALAVVTCKEEIWVKRLQGPREQPELVTQDMRNWANMLREDTVKVGGSVIDTSASDLAASLKDVANLIQPLLKTRVGV